MHPSELPPTAPLNHRTPPLLPIELKLRILSMSSHDSFPRPPPHHQPRLAHFTPNSADQPLVDRWLHSAYHDLHLTEYHPGTHRLPPFHDNFLVGREWVQWDKLSMRCFVSPDGRAMYGLVYFSDECEGPRQCVHGGCLATLLDELHVAAVSYNAQSPPWTKQLTLQYKRPVLLGGTVQFRCAHTEAADGSTTPGTCELLSLTRSDGTVAVAVAETSESLTLLVRSEAVCVVKGGRGLFQRHLVPKLRELNEPIPAKL